MRKLSDYFRQMIEAGNRVSSVRFFLLGTLAMGLMFYLTIIAILIRDVWSDGVIDSSLEGITSLVHAVGINMGVGGLTKCFSSLFELFRKPNEVVSETA